MLTQFLKFFKALNSDAGPWQLSFAVGLALIIGLTPLWSVHNLIVILLACILRVHFGTFLVFWVVFSGFAYLLDPAFDAWGYAWLTSSALTPTWTALYQSDWWQVMKFNHTITLGSVVVSLLLFVPAVLAMRIGVVRYRAQLMPWANRLKLVQIVKASKVYTLYEKVS
jgi:uncharacterized protein (TIGR03546 family)